MKQVKTWITSIVPVYGVIPVVFAFVFNSIVYSGAQLITGSWYHYNIENRLDGMIPFIPQTILIYLGCYVFWVVNYILIARQSKEKVYQFFAGDMFSRMICFAFFILFPTTNIRPEIAGHNFWADAMRWLYSMDDASNLFPSIHCLMSWFCYIAIRKNENIPRWYRRLSLIIAIAVFISTLTTKQHVIVDVIGGVVLAEISFWIGKHTCIARWYGRIFDKMTGLFLCCTKERKSEEQKENMF